MTFKAKENLFTEKMPGRKFAIGNNLKAYANIEDLVEMKIYVDKKTGAIVYVPKEEPKFITYKFIEE
jgi:hypothetical protein